MTHLGKTLGLCAVLALGACSQSDKSGGMGGDGGVGGAGYGTGGYGTDSGISTGIIPGSANDPNSPAYFQQTVGDRVLFEVDQSTLTAAAKATLDGQAQWLNEHPEFDIIIEGHADEQGTREYNLALGARRATAAHTYLLSKGVSSSRMRTVSYGKERPLEICSEEACYAKNRRAVTVISGGQVS